MANWQEPDKHDLEIYCPIYKSCYVEGNNGYNFIVGSVYDDQLNGRGGCDVIHGSYGNDAISLGSFFFYDGCDNSEMAFGDEGDDTILGTTVTDSIDGGDGDDWIFSAGGNDYVDGGGNNDHIDGGEGNDELYGGAGVDLVMGNSGADWVYGGMGDDCVCGDICYSTARAGDGTDHMYGDEDNDRLCDANTETDYFYGGSGVDSYWQFVSLTDYGSGNENHLSSACSYCASLSNSVAVMDVVHSFGAVVE